MVKSMKKRFFVVNRNWTINYFEKEEDFQKVRKGGTDVCGVSCHASVRKRAEPMCAFGRNLKLTPQVEFDCKSCLVTLAARCCGTNRVRSPRERCIWPATP